MNRKFLVIGIIGLAVVVLVAVAVFGVGKKPASPERQALEMWGFGDDDTVWRGISAQFTEKNPHITISYRGFAEPEYRDLLVNRLAEARGPDIFLLKNAWITKERDKILAFGPESSPVSAAQFRNIFVDGAADELADNRGMILGFPLFMDSLALFYNKDLFDSAGIAAAPATWDDVARISQTLTAISPSGEIARSGMALGAGANVARAMEIASAMILQEGDPVVRPNRSVALEEDAGRAFAFYASFADPRGKNFSWDPRMPNSLDAFADEKAAMAIGFAEDVAKIRARNPRIAMGVAFLPQFRTSVQRTSGYYLFPAVSGATRRPDAARQFVLYLASRDGTAAYLKAASRPPARRDLIGADPAGSPADLFARQALIARSWPVPDEQASRRIFNDALDQAANKTLSIPEALGRIREQLRLLLP